MRINGKIDPREGITRENLPGVARQTRSDANGIYYALADYFQTIDPDTDLDRLADLASTAAILGYWSVDHEGNRFDHFDNETRIELDPGAGVIIYSDRTKKAKKARFSVREFLDLA